MVMKQLKDAEVAVLATIKSYEEALQEWRDQAPVRLAAAITAYGDGKQNSGYREFDFSPPKLNPACADWRVQALNKGILRIDAMTPMADGSIVIRGDDPLWDYVGLAACL